MLAAGACESPSAAQAKSKLGKTMSTANKSALSALAIRFTELKCRATHRL